MVDNGSDDYIFYLEVADWKIFIPAAIQKIISLFISAKVLITSGVILIATYLVLKPISREIVLQAADGGQKIDIIKAPILSGEQWASLMTQVLVAFLAARLAPKIVKMVSDSVVKSRNGNQRGE